MADPQESALLIESLSKSFGAAPVLRDINLQVASGSLLAILGASGGGKTTLLRLICGFERAQSGRISAGGRLLADGQMHMPPERRNIGYVAQDGALFPHLSVSQNVLFGLPRQSRRMHGKAAALLELVGLTAAFAARYPHELSGGEQQRVALARALAPAPSLVLLDEPFSALDAALRQETRAAVTRALSAAGATALLVTHDQSEALSLGTQVAVLRHGRVVQVASPQTLYRQPADLAVARFVGEAVIVPGEAHGNFADCIFGKVPLLAPAHGAVDLLVRPEQVRLLPPGDGVVIASVEQISFGGHDAMVTLRLANAATMIARVSGMVMLEIGDRVGVSVEGMAVAYS